MKRKLLIIASLLMLVLSGCHCNCEEVQTKKNYYMPENVKEFNYKGHDYIKFEDSYSQYKNSGVVHNPDYKKCRGW